MAYDHNNTDPAIVKRTAFLDEVLKTLPLKRLGKVEDVSNLVSFLVSRDSDCRSLMDSLIVRTVL